MYLYGAAAPSKFDTATPHCAQLRIAILLFVRVPISRKVIYSLSIQFVSRQRKNVPNRCSPPRKITITQAFFRYNRTVVDIFLTNG